MPSRVLTMPGFLSPDVACSMFPPAVATSRLAAPLQGTTQSSDPVETRQLVQCCRCSRLPANSPPAHQPASPPSSRITLYKTIGDLASPFCSFLSPLNLRPRHFAPRKGASLCFPYSRRSETEIIRVNPGNEDESGPALSLRSYRSASLLPRYTCTVVVYVATSEAVVEHISSRQS